MISGAGVPDAPLPVARHVRIALLGVETPRLLAVQAALQSTGRFCTRYDFSDVVGRPDSLDVDLVIVCCDLDELIRLSKGLASALEGVVVLCPMVDSPREHAGDDLAASRESAVEQVSAALPGARVVGALQQFTAEHLTLLAVGALETDAPVTADDREAADLVEAILDEVPGIAAVFAGPLRNASAIEGIGTVLQSVEQNTGQRIGFRLDPARGLVFLYGR